jgi:hypothetical protein
LGKNSFLTVNLQKFELPDGTLRTYTKGKHRESFAKFFVTLKSLEMKKATDFKNQWLSICGLGKTKTGTWPCLCFNSLTCTFY